MDFRYAKHALLLASILLLTVIYITMPLLAQPHTINVKPVIYSPNGSLIATGGADGMVKIWDAMTGQNVQTLQGHAREIFDVAWSPDGERIASADGGGTMLIWNTSTWQIILTITDTDERFDPVFFDIDWKPDGTQIVVSSDLSGVKVFDTTTGAFVKALLGHAREVSAVAWSPEGNYILGGGWDAQLILWDANSGQIINRMTESDINIINTIDWHPNGLYAAVGSSDGIIRIWNPFNNTVITRIQADNNKIFGVLIVTWSSNGTYLASGGGDENIRIWDGTNYVLLQTIPVDSVIDGLSFNPSQPMIAYYTISDESSPLKMIQGPTLTPTNTYTPTQIPLPTVAPTNTPTTTPSHTPPPPTPTHTPPPPTPVPFKANAGPDQSIQIVHDGMIIGSPKAYVTLNGSQSTGTITGYQWSRNGQPVSGQAITTLQLTPGSYLFTLTISNGAQTNTDTVTVNITTCLYSTPGCGSPTE